MIPAWEGTPPVDNGALQACQGGPGHDSFNGHGQVNALKAVLR
jgi:lantibiotic leader peptide-processing serine protease